MHLPQASLDAILALQFTVAWAGEGKCSPRRLGWWDTDLIDPAGGGDLLARLLPQTHAWASLEAAREAARRVDAKARSKMAARDKMRTLFFLGFELDEQLNDRLAALKTGQESPAQVLPLKLTLQAVFSEDELRASLGASPPKVTVVPGGRQINGAMPDSPIDAVTCLAAALLPFAEHYPLPFYSLEG